MNKLISIICLVLAVLVVIIGYVIGSYNHVQKKYKMNLKCIQGELYEEVRTNMYVKSHLECFEQRTF
jgi:uncharacterized ion transporter superfamily protein YfcC